MKAPFLKHAALAAALVLALSACNEPGNDGEDTPPPTPTPTPAPTADFNFSDVESMFLNGGNDKIWIGRCVPVVDDVASYQTIQMRFETVDGVQELGVADVRYSDSNCHTAIYDIGYLYTLTLGNAVVTDGGEIALPMDVSLIDLYVVPISMSSVTAFNSSAKCGATDWAQGDFKNEAGNCGFPDFGEIKYDLLYYSHATSRVELGNFSAHDGLSAATRPTGLETVNYFELFTSSPATLRVSVGPNEISTMDFGAIPMNGGATVMMTLTNWGDVEASSIAIAQSPANAFSFVGGSFPGTNGDCGATLAPNASCSFYVRFAPGAVAGFNSSFSISYQSQSQGKTKSISLTGSGTNYSCSSTMIADANTAGAAQAQTLDDGHFWSTSFDLQTPSQIANVVLNLTADAGVTGNVKVFIASNTGGISYWGNQGPGALKIDPIATLAANTLPTTGPSGALGGTLNRTITLSSPLSLPAGTYWIVIETSGTGTNGKFAYVGANGSANSRFHLGFLQYNNGGAWQVYDSASVDFAVNTCL